MAAAGKGGPDPGARHELREAALAYARRGWHVFPLRPGAKVPATAHGVKDATSHEAIIRRWWGENPAANIGLSCGPSGILAVDVDTKDGKPGLATWHELAASLGIPENGTLTNRTPTGGLHLLYTMPAEVRLGNSAGRLGEGLDTRGDGGYIVVPPSTIGASRYRWEDPDVLPTPCPAALVEELTREELPPHPWAGNRVTLAEMLAQEPEPERWIVERAIEVGSLNIVYGPAGSLKSMLVADLVMCVASNLRWLSGSDGAGRAVESCPVVWCDLDNGKKKTHKRLRALAAAHGVGDAPVTVFSFPPLDLADPESVAILRDAILTEGAGLVVIDTLINATSVENENDNAQMRGPMFALRKLCEETGAAIILIHHPSKSVLPASGHNDLRGAGVVAGAVDLLLRVSREEHVVTVTATKTRGAEVPAFSAEWEYHQNISGDLTAAQFLGKRHETPAQKADAELEAAVLRELDPEETSLKKLPATREEIRKAVKGKTERVIAILPRLVTEGKVRAVTDPGKRGKRYEKPG